MQHLWSWVNDSERLRRQLQCSQKLETQVTHSTAELGGQDSAPLGGGVLSSSPIAAAHEAATDNLMEARQFSPFVLGKVMNT
ncbi:hypothetical protein E2C01_026976 [Portunus trituberculatus]|uniref:Uncharacterized protein n=1 Tax=Portunus trituberculatus TaxID=210409 RepID=A0A5B7EGY7_PORTR|nr:hypothetical protein [Portunus trituberculatus]